MIVLRLTASFFTSSVAFLNYGSGLLWRREVEPGPELYVFVFTCFGEGSRDPTFRLAKGISNGASLGSDIWAFKALSFVSSLPFTHLSEWKDD